MVNKKIKVEQPKETKLNWEIRYSEFMKPKIIQEKKINENMTEFVYGNRPNEVDIKEFIKNERKQAIEKERNRIFSYLDDHLQNKGFENKEIKEVANIIFDKPL